MRKKSSASTSTHRTVRCSAARGSLAHETRAGPPSPWHRFTIRSGQFVKFMVPKAVMITKRRVNEATMMCGPTRYTPRSREHTSRSASHVRARLSSRAISTLLLINYNSDHDTGGMRVSRRRRQRRQCHHRREHRRRHRYAIITTCSRLQSLSSSRRFFPGPTAPRFERGQATINEIA